MKRVKISNNVIRRLPKYLRKLDELTDSGVERISSGELGRQMGLTPSQIRQDFSCFGEFGQQGYGYNVVGLREEIGKIMGMDREFTCVLVGVGNIGKSLIGHFSFNNYGFHLIGAFDIKSDLIGSSIRGIPVYDMQDLRKVLEEIHPDAAVLCIPGFYANEVAPVLVDCGIRAIWNFTNVELDISDSDTVIENIYFSDSLMALTYYLSEHNDELEALAEKQKQ